MFLKFLISIKYCFIFALRFKDLKIIESFSGLSPTPITFAPSICNQWDSHAPLKPVEPVIKTFKFL